MKWSQPSDNFLLKLTQTEMVLFLLKKLRLLMRKKMQLGVIRNKLISILVITMEMEKFQYMNSLINSRNRFNRKNLSLKILMRLNLIKRIYFHWNPFLYKNQITFLLIKKILQLIKSNLVCLAREMVQVLIIQLQ